MINICIIHYNTPDLTTALVKSINKFVQSSNIYIFDNSTKNPFVNTFDNVTVFDNTKGELLNFDNILKNYPNRNKSLGRHSGFGSFKHCISVQKCFELINNNFILMDSDVLLKRNIDELWNNDYIFISDLVDWSWNFAGATDKVYPIHTRVRPFICFINVNKCKEYGITYYSDTHMVGLYNTDIDADSYDTGCWFYEQASNYKYKKIDYLDYVVHFGGGSYKTRNKKGKTKSQFLNENKQLFE